MTQPSTPQPTQAERRKARQAAALRDNLKRRKAQLRDTAPDGENDRPPTANHADQPKAP